jgi:sucrose phosphorylase
MEKMIRNDHKWPDTAEFTSRIARRLQAIYRDNFSEGLVNRILQLAHVHYDKRPAWDEKEVILIAYGNSICRPDEPPLRTLHRFLRQRLFQIISCVHILPYFPFTSDDGFSVTDYLQVNPDLGDWKDIDALTSDFGMMTDLVINHVSAEHPWFKNYLADRVPGRNYFIAADPRFDCSRVIRPRSTPLFTRFKIPGGHRDVWTTFSSDQVDLNFANPDVLVEMIRILLFYISKGMRIIRLDAIAFLWKKTGTTCLHQPETHQIVKLLRDIATHVCPGTVILTETNVPNLENWSYFGNDDEAHMVYQFSLPPLLLHALFSGTSRYLNQWASEIPELAPTQTFLNYTASHDGIGVRPLEGLLPGEEIRELLEGMTRFRGQISNKVNPDGSLSPYEINITYLDALKGNRDGIDGYQEARFICSQAIMMSLQGIPAFYLNSLVGTANDEEGVKVSGRVRSINRKLWQEDELKTMLSEETVHRRLFGELCRLIKIRRDYPLFHPGCQQEILMLDDRLFAFKRMNLQTGERIYCLSNVTDRPIEIKGILGARKKGYDLISAGPAGTSDRILFNPYQMRWIIEDFHR